MPKFLQRILLGGFLMFMAMHASFARPIIEKPHFFYLVGNDYSVKYRSFGSAYAVVAARLGTQLDPSTGMAHQRAVGAEPSGVTINETTILRAKIEYLEYNQTTKQYDTWVPQPGAGGGLVNTIPECGGDFTLELRAGSTTNVQLFQCVSKFSYPEPCSTCGVGNPILPSTMAKLQEEVDYTSAGPGGLKFVRIYRSDRNGWANNFSPSGEEQTLTPPPPPEDPLVPLADTRGRLGCRWDRGASSGFMHCYKPMPTGLEDNFMLRRGGGPTIEFGGKASFLKPEKHVNDRWWPVSELGRVIAHDIYNPDDDSIERYNLDGFIQKITYRNGNVTRFAYVAFSGQATPTSPGVVLSSVTDHFGRRLSFTYDLEGRLETMTTPGNEVYTYRYDEESGGATPVGNLTSVTYPDGHKRIYWYNEPAHSGGGFPFALTGITDENGARYATFKYNQAGFAWSTEHAGGVYKYTVEQSGSDRAITDPLGAIRIDRYAEKQGGLRVLSRSQPAGSGSPAATAYYTYDDNGNLDTYTELNGTITKYTYDLDRNLELTRTEAVGLAEQRKTSTEWHPTYRIPQRIAEPKRITSFVYFENGQVKTRSVQATTDPTGALGFAAVKTGPVSTWTYAYNGNGQVASVTGPRAGGVDRTTYAYDLATGDLLSVTNAAGHVTTFSEYDGNGRPHLVTAPNRVTTRMSYSPRGWLESRTVSDGTTSMTTRYAYDAVGQVTSITQPDNTTITLAYDDAHRLTDVFDSAGNRIHYALNNLGARLSEDVTDPGGTLRRQITRQFDILNRVQSQIGGAQ